MVGALLVLSSLSTAWAIDPVVRELSHGTVNWTTLELCAAATEANSSGSMAGYEALEGRARARLGPLMLTLAREVQLDSKGTTGDLMQSTDAIADKIDANVSLWEVTEARYYTSGRVDIEVCLPMQGWLRPELSRLATGVDRSSPPDVPITGLVVDARGLALKPAVNPEIRDPSGAVVYSAASMTSFAASQRPFVVYVTDPADPIAVRRAGEQPVIVRAAAVTDGVNLTLDPAGAAALKKASDGAGFMAQGTVVVVTDR